MSVYGTKISSARSHIFFTGKLGKATAIMLAGDYYNGELSEAIRKDIPNFNPLLKMVKNYTPDQQGQDIRPQDVARPINRRWAKSDEVETWRKLSNERSPTYGS